MCTRFYQDPSAETFPSVNARSPQNSNLEPRYNIGPMKPAYVVRHDAKRQRETVRLRWWLLPAWQKDPKPTHAMLNARAETVREKPSFRGAFKARRCLVPANGWYEWMTEGTGKAMVKNPFLIKRADGAVIWFAGLWERWEPKGYGTPDVAIGPDGAALEPIESFAIVTTEPGPDCAMIHDRQPLVLADTPSIDSWMTGTPDTAAALMVPSPKGSLVWYPVSRDVNSVKSEGPHLIEPIGPGGP